MGSDVYTSTEDRHVVVFFLTYNLYSGTWEHGQIKRLELACPCVCMHLTGRRRFSGLSEPLDCKHEGLASARPSGTLRPASL